MKSKCPKWKSVAEVDMMKCAVTKGRKGQKNSNRVIADSPIKAVHHLSTDGEDGEAQHWLRLFLFEGRKYIHNGYHTLNANGNVQFGQYGSMLPKEDFEVLIIKAIENGIITLPSRFSRTGKHEGCAVTPPRPRR